MQFTTKFILLAIALAYGSTAVSAVPIRESSYDLNAREIDDVELFVRNPFRLFGFGTPSSTPSSSTPSPETVNSHTGAGLSVSILNFIKKFKLV